MIGNLYFKTQFQVEIWIENNTIIRKINSIENDDLTV